MAFGITAWGSLHSPACGWKRRPSPRRTVGCAVVEGTRQGTTSVLFLGRRRCDHGGGSGARLSPETGSQDGSGSSTGLDHGSIGRPPVERYRIAAALRLAAEVRVLDFGGSHRAGLAALGLATRSSGGSRPWLSDRTGCGPVLRAYRRCNMVRVRPPFWSEIEESLPNCIGSSLQHHASSRSLQGGRRLLRLLLGGALDSR